MTDCYTFDRGDSPLLISIPHDGRKLAPGMPERMTETGLSLPDTDWHVRKLYDFASTLGAGAIAANYSRYVIDLNRPSSDAALYEGQLSTGLCPVNTFSGDPIYRGNKGPDAEEIQQRTATYWMPYHDKIETELSRLKDRFGYALLWDAHSIKTMVPDLFNGELPELSIGTSNGTSCDVLIERAVVSAAKKSNFTSVTNGRFNGGQITRHFGVPRESIHAIQLELTQHCYMDESSGEYETQLAAKLIETLTTMLSAFVEHAEHKYN